MIRKPLVIINGDIQELPEEDSINQQFLIPGTMFSPVVEFISDLDEFPQLVFERDSLGRVDIVMESN